MLGAAKQDVTPSESFAHIPRGMLGARTRRDATLPICVPLSDRDLDLIETSI
jgi:hypothetical protein